MTHGNTENMSNTPNSILFNPKKGMPDTSGFDLFRLTSEPGSTGTRTATSGCMQAMRELGHVRPRKTRQKM
jgi:hypothetical protein